MKSDIFARTGLAIAFLYAMLILPAMSMAGSSSAPWEELSRPRRILLDWRSNDAQNPSEPTEIFLNTTKLAATTGIDHLSPGSFTFVAENTDGSFQQMPFASRDELGRFGRQGTAFRFVPPPQAKRLWMYFGGTDGSAQTLSTQWNLLDGFFDSTSWQVSDPHVTATVADQDGGHALHILYDDKNQPGNPNTNAEISRSFPIPPDCRGVEAKVAFDLKTKCEQFVPLTLLLRQFDKDGKQLDACIVDPRWLSMCAASGQDIKFREQGLIYPSAVSMTLTIGLWAPQRRDPIMNFDETWKQYPPSDNIEIEITRAELRAAHPITFPGIEKSLFAAGITAAPDDLSLVINEGDGFCYDANPPAVWSEGALPSDPRVYHWPCGAGTFECWIYPQWDANDPGKRYIINALASYGAENSVLAIFYTPATGKFHVMRANLSGEKTDQEAVAAMTPGQWHHLAYTWDPADGHQELFVDGASVMSHSGDPISSIDIHDLGSAKQIPGRVWLGQTNDSNSNKPSRIVDGVSGNDNALHGRMDEVRISDGIRYSSPFTPQHTSFTLDQDTRALFHFDGRTDGLNDSEDARVMGTILSPMSPISEKLDYERQGSAGVVQGEWVEPKLPDAVNPLKLFPVALYPPLKADDFNKSSIDRQAVFHLKPGDSTVIKCDAQPYMDWVEMRCPDDGTMIGRPFLAKPGEIDPRTLTSLMASLGIDKLSSPRDKADAIFKYLVGHNDYFWTTGVEVEPSGAMLDPNDSATVLLNGYLQYGCGAQNRMVRDCFLKAGLSADMTHGSAHVFEQVFYDGSWHLYDLFARVFFPARDNQRPAALSEVERDPYLAVRVERPAFGFWLASDTRKYQFPDREIEHPDMSYRLRPGESFRYYWHNDGRYNPISSSQTDHSAPWEEGPTVRGKKLQWANHFPPYAANGVFSFACTPREDHPALSDWNGGGFVYRFLSPYAICGAYVNVSSGNGSAPTVELSFDEGSTWMPAPPAGADGRIVLDRLCVDHHLYWVRVTPPAGGRVQHFEHRAVVLMNPSVLTPVLAKGDNTLQFTAESGSAADVTIQYHEESDTPLEIDGGSRFGWATGHARQLMVCQPGGSFAFNVKQCSSSPSVVVPSGATAVVERAGDSEWHVNVQVPASFADGLYPVTVSAGERNRTAAVLIASGARLVSAGQAASQGEAAMTTDPDGIHGQVLDLHAGAQAVFPLNGDGKGPLAVYALAKLPQQTENMATILLSSGPATLLDHNYAHAFWTQEHLTYQWKWYHVRAGGYPWQTLAVVNLPDPNSATINCTEGQTLIDALLVIPAGDERLVEATTQYLFSANYDPWMFPLDWGPSVTGAPYPAK